MDTVTQNTDRQNWQKNDKGPEQQRIIIPSSWGRTFVNNVNKFQWFLQWKVLKNAKYKKNQIHFETTLSQPGFTW